MLPLALPDRGWGAFSGHAIRGASTRFDALQTALLSDVARLQLAAGVRLAGPLHQLVDQDVTPGGGRLVDDLDACAAAAQCGDVPFPAAEHFLVGAGRRIHAFAVDQQRYAQ